MSCVKTWGDVMRRGEMTHVFPNLGSTLFVPLSAGITAFTTDDLVLAIAGFVNSVLVLSGITDAVLGSVMFFMEGLYSGGCSTFGGSGFTIGSVRGFSK